MVQKCKEGDGMNADCEMLRIHCRYSMPLINYTPKVRLDKEISRQNEFSWWGIET